MPICGRVGSTRVELIQGDITTQAVGDYLRKDPDAFDEVRVVLFTSADLDVWAGMMEALLPR